jgi:hypothetical protein
MSVIKRHKSTILGLTEDLAGINAAIQTEVTERGSAVAGALQAIADEATARNTAIGTAISTEVSARDTAIGTAVAAEATARDAAISTAVAAEATARDAAIDTAKLALGTNYVVDTNAERDALTGLDTADIVTVLNAGAWVKYGVESVVEGVATFYTILSKEQFEATQTADAIKAALLSNPDTHVLTDAELAKLTALSLEDLVLISKLVKGSVDFSAAVAGTVADAPTIRDFVNNSVRTGGQINVTETLLVTSDRITLSKAPKDGCIYNYATARGNIDGLSYDIPVAYDSTADGTANAGRVYILSPDAPGDFDGKNVVIQYPAISAA